MNGLTKQLFPVLEGPYRIIVFFFGCHYAQLNIIKVNSLFFSSSNVDSAGELVGDVSLH